MCVGFGFLFVLGCGFVFFNEEDLRLVVTTGKLNANFLGKASETHTRELGITSNPEANGIESDCV